jgi:anti-anti-sigma factor
MPSQLSAPLPHRISIGCGAYSFDASSPRQAASFHDIVLVVPITGDLDVDTAPGFADWLAPMAAHGCHLVLDLSGVTSLGCAGLTLFVDLDREAIAAGGSLHLCPVPASILRVIQAAGSDAKFDTHVPAARTSGGPLNGWSFDQLERDISHHWPTSRQVNGAPSPDGEEHTRSRSSLS